MSSSSTLIRISLLGIASWVLPFVLSFAFYNKSGELVVSQSLFKSLMVVLGGGVGITLLVWAFKYLKPTWKSGLAIGLYWFVVNIVLDVLVLMPMMKVGFNTYLADIGLRYLLIIFIAVGIGVVAARANK